MGDEPRTPPSTDAAAWTPPPPEPPPWSPPEDTGTFPALAAGPDGGTEPGVPWPSGAAAGEPAGEPDDTMGSGPGVPGEAAYTVPVVVPPRRRRRVVVLRLCVLAVVGAGAWIALATLPSRAAPPAPPPVPRATAPAASPTPGQSARTGPGTTPTSLVTKNTRAHESTTRTGRTTAKPVTTATRSREPAHTGAVASARTTAAVRP